jgi:hypothetical protein
VAAADSAAGQVFDFCSVAGRRQQSQGRKNHKPKTLRLVSNRWHGMCHLLITRLLPRACYRAPVAQLGENRAFGNAKRSSLQAESLPTCR